MTRACTNCHLDPFNLNKTLYFLNNANSFPVVHNLLDVAVMVCLSSLTALLCFAHRGSAGGVFQQHPTVFKAITRSWRKDLKHVARTDR